MATKELDESIILLNALETFAINSLKSKINAYNNPKLLANINLKNYYKMIEELNTNDAISLARWYTVLLKTVNYITITGEMKEFITQIFNFNFNISLDTIKIYLHFLNTLVSANIDFLIPSLKIMCQHLLYNTSIYILF